MKDEQLGLWNYKIPRANIAKILYRVITVIHILLASFPFKWVDGHVEPHDGHQ
jgi:hypothetical protein